MDKRGCALAVVLLAAVMDLLDGTVVNIVLPSIQRELAADNAAAGWIASGYTLVRIFYIRQRPFSVLVCSALRDRYNRRAR